MGRRLIVANQTMGGAELERHVKDRIEAGATEFYVVVPMIEVEKESSWTAPDDSFGVQNPGDVDSKAVDQARKRSSHRLHAMMEKVASLGGTADGEVGDSDPVAAVRTIVHAEEFDEVIVSTLPAGMSRWLKMDLPSRVERMVDCPVTTVEASG